MGDIPKAIWEGEIKVGGIVLHCAVLDNGKRVINTEDVGNLFFEMEGGDFSPTGEELETLGIWTLGIWSRGGIRG